MPPVQSLEDEAFRGVREVRTGVILETKVGRNQGENARSHPLPNHQLAYPAEKPPVILASASDVATTEQSTGFPVASYDPQCGAPSQLDKRAKATLIAAGRSHRPILRKAATCTMRAPK